jgi:Zn-dependent alcohol dehydrogenase
MSTSAPRAWPGRPWPAATEGHIKLTELITNKNALDEINDGYQDLMDGKNIRGVVVHSGS